MLTITSEAADAIKGIVEANDLPEGSGLRITAEEDGDEVSIELDFAERPETGDDVVESEGVRVFLDETASQVLTEVELTVTPPGDHVHFVFNERGDGAGEPRRRRLIAYFPSIEKAYSLLFVVPGGPRLVYPDPQNTVPFEIAAPDRHDPPLGNSQRTAPVAPFSAYM